MGGGGGVDHVPKVLRHFLGLFGPIHKLPHGCPKWADTKVASRMSKNEGGGLRPSLDNVMASLRRLPEEEKIVLVFSSKQV